MSKIPPERKQNWGPIIEVPPNNHIRKTNVWTPNVPYVSNSALRARDRSSAPDTHEGYVRTFLPNGLVSVRSLPAFRFLPRRIHTLSRSLRFRADPHALSSGSDRWIQRFTAPGCQQQLVGGSPVFKIFKTDDRTNDFSCEKSRYLSSAGLFIWTDDGLWWCSSSPAAALAMINFISRRRILSPWLLVL
jgi:hypothetical protein